MESFWLEAAKQAPSLAVLAWIVWQFLKQQKLFIRQISDSQTAYQCITEKCNANQKLQAEALQENTIVTREAAEALKINARANERHTSILDRLEQKLHPTAWTGSMHHSTSAGGNTNAKA